MMQIFDMEQGEEEWLRARMGIPTSSKFATVMAKGEGKIRAEYMRRLAGEVLTGEPSETFTNSHMERGRMMEDEARELYAFVEAADIRRVGFIRNGSKGCSPDSLVGENGGLEIKVPFPTYRLIALSAIVFRPNTRPRSKETFGLPSVSGGISFPTGLACQC